jgi:hypothetical protein
MSQENLTSGQDYVVARSDRSFGGRTKEVLRISGRDGSVKYSAPVEIKGSLTINGQLFTGAPSGTGGALCSETLGRPLRLSAAPLSSVCLFVNGQLQSSEDFSVGNDGLVIWKCSDFTIAPSDKVEAVYET